MAGGGWPWGTGTNFVQRQFNIVGSTTYAARNHDMKFGVDFRRVFPLLSGKGGGGFQLLQIRAPELLTGRAFNYQTTTSGQERLVAAFDSLSLYAQDSWRATSRLTLTYGVRWEYVPPARAIEGPNAITLDNIDDPYGGQVHVAPTGTPLWATRYDNVAPRVGGSVVLVDRQGAQLIVRGGYGLFYDLGFGQVASAFRAYPFTATNATASPAFPLASSTLAC
jgi:outer membrane receptor protein involved in Fe transport